MKTFVYITSKYFRQKCRMFYDLTTTQPSVYGCVTISWWEINPANKVQIPIVAFCVSVRASVLGEGMIPFFLPSVAAKLLVN